MELKQKTNEAFWQKHCVNWRSSNKTQAEYCTQEKISVHTLRKFICFFNKKNKTKAKSRFVVLEKPVHKTTIDHKSNDELLSKPLKLYVGNRFCIEIPRYFSEATLTQTIKVIEGL